ENGITNIITLTMELPIVSKYTKSITFHHIPVSVEPSEEQINLFLKIIETIRNKGEKAVVHCQYGQERTGIFLVHYFMKFIDKNLDIAFKEVRKGRLSCLQNSNSKHHLVNYYT
ncbi:MAG: dual specificity protein phosphatase family protein, partial [Candidatus Heimdallarchaeota archaeon]|nr:dual specificity protein phosphatase family protein [Candidatus Heimdallarchaeota archaeon]